MKWVDWNGIEALQEGPARGRFGWDDSFVILIGVQHRYNDKLTLRAGWTYGNSPIPEQNTFGNSLFPAITEHHFSVGASYKLNDLWEITGSAFHALEADQTDNGQGDGKSQVGKNVRISMWQVGAQVGITRKF